MARFETINSWFYPSETKVGGVIIPAPPEAVEKYEELKAGWYKDHPKLPKEIPAVSISQSKDPEKRGYVVRAEILYK